MTLEGETHKNLKTGNTHKKAQLRKKEFAKEHDPFHWG